MQVFDIREFGAQGDSIHDDTPALRAAWAAARGQAESEAPQAAGAETRVTPDEQAGPKAASVGP